MLLLTNLFQPCETLTSETLTSVTLTSVTLTSVTLTSVTLGVKISHPYEVGGHQWERG
jgi:hypothetical protein